jgi:hypothetical protein
MKDKAGQITFQSIGKRRVLIFILGLLTLAYWVIANSINVYRFVLIEAVFEMSSFPMLVLLFFIPVYSIIQMWKYKTGLNSLPFYSILIIALTVAILFIIT